MSIFKNVKSYSASNSITQSFSMSESSQQTIMMSETKSDLHQKQSLNPNSSHKLENVLGLVDSNNSQEEELKGQPQSKANSENYGREQDTNKWKRLKNDPNASLPSPNYLIPQQQTNSQSETYFHKPPNPSMQRFGSLAEQNVHTLRHLSGQMNNINTQQLPVGNLHPIRAQLDLPPEIPPTIPNERVKESYNNHHFLFSQSLLTATWRITVIFDNFRS